MAVQRYIHDILQTTCAPATISMQPHVFLQPYPCSHSATALRSHFQQDNARPQMARLSQDFLHTITTLSSSARSLYLSPIENIWDHLSRRVGHPMNLNELEARLQQIWNEMSQDIIHNLYVSMPDRIALCNRARGGSTGY
ncbi:transposable element Tcb1 transposase [Trichonephila clavipes]|nr:transposable element Tcb1 transposase [Trichonephila clavipes]